MSGYYEEPKRRSHRSKRPVYQEEVVESRTGRSGRGTDLVRRRDSSDSIEEVRRDFPPENAYIQRRYTARDKYAPRTRSVDRSAYHDGSRTNTSYSGRRGRYDSMFDSSIFDSSIRFLTNRSGRRYESESDSDYSSPPRHRRKSLGEQALAAVGLGGAASALTGRDRSRDRSRGRGRREYSRSRSRSRSVDNVKKMQQAAKAAITAGAIEAWRSRKEPGGLAGQGKRIFTAAVGAAGTSGAIDNNPDKHSTRHTIESAIGGLAGNHLINGPREKSRSRSRSRGRGSKESESKIGGVASAAAIAGLAGKAFQNYREKSRGRRGSFSSDDRDDRDDRSRPQMSRKRSKSVSEFVTRNFDKGLAAVGLGQSEYHDPKYKKDKFGRRHYDEDDDYVARPRGGGGEERGSSTDSYSSQEEIKKQKKMRGKEFLTAGLATIATIHAAHGVHSSMQAGKDRHKKVMQGKMSPEEARRLKSKALLQDAAAVGIAALGVKGTVSEWKEVNEQRHEMQASKKRLAELREHRRQKLSRGESNRNSEPNLGGRYQHDDPPRYDGGSRYVDGNPYASSSGLPPPPMGSRY